MRASPDRATSRECSRKSPSRHPPDNKRVANILETLPPGNLGVVLSACRGVTDALLGLVARAEAQDDSYRGDLDALRARHAKIAETVLSAEAARLYLAMFDRDRHDIEG